MWCAPKQSVFAGSHSSLWRTEGTWARACLRLLRSARLATIVSPHTENAGNVADSWPQPCYLLSRTGRSAVAA